MLIGHDVPWREWREALAGGRMHHAWILAGKRGLGKMAFAKSAARALIGADEGLDDNAQHPDIHILTHLPKDDKEAKKQSDGKVYETKRNISVDQIRQMQRQLTTRPTLGDRRAIIIDPADDLEKSASNALLKNLEEPPVGTFFLLVTHRPARLLPTIRSRCRILRFTDLSPSQIGAILASEAPEADAVTRDAALAAANGSLGAALEFVAQDLGKVATLMQRIASEGDADFVSRGQLASEVGARPKRERITAILDLARAILADRMSDAERGDLPAIADAHANMVTLAGQAPTFNFDPGLLVIEVGGLLARAAGLRTSSNV